MFISLDLVVGRFDQGKKPKREIELHSIELYRLPPRQSFGTLLQPPTLLTAVLCTEDKVIIHKFRGEHFLWNRN